MWLLTHDRQVTYVYFYLLPSSAQFYIDTLCCGIRVCFANEILSKPFVYGWFLLWCVVQFVSRIVSLCCLLVLDCLPVRVCISCICLCAVHTHVVSLFPLLCPGFEVVLYFYFIKCYRGLSCTDSIVYNCIWLKMCLYIFSYWCSYNICKLLHFHDVTAGVSASHSCILPSAWISTQLCRVHFSVKQHIGWLHFLD